MAPTTQWPRNTILLLTSTLTVMAGATIAPALPEMEQHFQNVPYAELLVKLVLSVPGLVIAVTAPLMGWLLDRSSKRRLLIVCAALYGVAGTSGYFFEQSLYAILAGRILLGLAVAGIMVTCTTLIGDYFSGPERHRYMGLQAAFGGFGGVVFLATGGWLADIGWRVPFLIYLLPFVFLPGLFAYIKDPARPLPAGIQPENVATTTTNSPMVYFCFVLAALEVLTLYMVPVHFPFYAASLHLSNSTQIGFAIAFMLLVMSSVSMMYSFFKARATFRVLHAAGLLILGCGYVLLGHASSVSLTLLALAMAGAGLGLMRPNLVVWLMALAPAQTRGRTMGILISAFFIGQFLCPVLTQPLVQHWGYSGSFVAVGGVLVALAVGFLGVQLVSASTRKETRTA